MSEEKKKAGRKPDWLKVRLARGPNYARLKHIILKNKLHTVCEEALCPNVGRCWENGRATFMILGNTCTRSCTFCSVTSGHPGTCDEKEPQRVAEAICNLQSRRAGQVRNFTPPRRGRNPNVVITSVTRDDLEDGGAQIWAETIRRVHNAVPGISIETLVPDFRGSAEALKTIMDAKPEILGHNLETVPSLYKDIRPQANYERSLKLLNSANEHGMITKTAIMVGLGETISEVLELMKDAFKAGCDIFYVGQYLQPTKKHLPVHRYVQPDEFEMYRERGFEMGFKVVVSGPLVRSSYYSEEQAKYLHLHIH